jgi:hypothetical protein
MISQGEQEAIMGFVKKQNFAGTKPRAIERNVFMRFKRKIELHFGSNGKPDKVKFHTKDGDKPTPEGYNLFLDDMRDPADCVKHMKGEVNTDIYLASWMVVRDYVDFINTIEVHGLPVLISFDHDLAEGHYHKNMQSGQINYDSEDFKTDSYKTGYHCAKWLVEYCMDKKLKLPAFIVHSMNPVGKENINCLLINARKLIEV